MSFMALTKLTKKFYDDKLLWETFMGWGRAATYKKLREWCIDQGMVNPDTGTVSQMGVFFAMWRYAVNCPEEAYKGYQEWQMQYGNFPTFEDFCKDVLAHAFSKKAIVVGKRKKRDFVRQYIKSEVGDDVWAK